MNRAMSPALFVALGLTATTAAASLPAPSSPEPRLEPVFEAEVLLAPSVKVGPTPLGQREYIPIIGGWVKGPRLAGKVRPGGWDWQLHGGRGCTQIHADYFLEAEDGTIINVINRGKFCPAAGGGEETPFTSPEFEAPAGPHDWLNGGAYVSKIGPGQTPGRPSVHIVFYRAR